MKRLVLTTCLAAFAMGILAGCSNSGSPTGDAQMEKYEENAAKAEKLGGGDAAGNDGAQAEGETSGE